MVWEVRMLPERCVTLEVTEQSFCESVVVVDDDAFGRCQILACMIRCTLAEAGRTAGCLVLSTDSRRSFAVLYAVLYAVRHMLVRALDRMTVAAAHDKTLVADGKREAGSDVRGLEVEAGAVVVAHDLEGNDIVADSEDELEVAAEVPCKNYEVVDIQEAAGNARHSLLAAVEGRTW